MARFDCSGISFVNKRQAAPAATRKKTLSPSTKESVTQVVTKAMRSALFKTKTAWPPSRIQIGIKLRIFSQAPARAKAAHKSLPVFHQIKAQATEAIQPARGPAKLTAARVCPLTPKACQR